MKNLKCITVTASNNIICVCVTLFARLSGQERFGNMTRVYYREAMGAFIVFDVTRPASFEAVTKWKEDLDSKLTLADGKHVATVLLANKCDQGRDVLTNNGIKMEQFCQENGFVGWFETSAKVRKMTNRHTHEYTYTHSVLTTRKQRAAFNRALRFNPRVSASLLRGPWEAADSLTLSDLAPDYPVEMPPQRHIQDVKRSFKSAEFNSPSLFSICISITEPCCFCTRVSQSTFLLCYSRSAALASGALLSRQDVQEC